MSINLTLIPHLSLPWHQTTRLSLLSGYRLGFSPPFPQMCTAYSIPLCLASFTQHLVFRGSSCWRPHPNSSVFGSGLWPTNRLFYGCISFISSMFGLFPSLGCFEVIFHLFLAQNQPSQSLGWGLICVPLSESQLSSRPESCVIILEGLCSLPLLRSCQ